MVSSLGETKLLIQNQHEEVCPPSEHFVLLPLYGSNTCGSPMMLKGYKIRDMTIACFTDFGTEKRLKVLLALLPCNLNTFQITFMTVNEV